MLLMEFNDFCTGILFVSALWQKLGEKVISAAPEYTGEKPTVETVMGEIANPDMYLILLRCFLDILHIIFLLMNYKIDARYT